MVKAFCFICPNIAAIIFNKYSMSTYKHFGKQPDVLKHLVLCEVLQNENPSTYVETNSACAIYQMEHTPEQQYGIYHFLERANDENGLKDSMYYKLENQKC